MNAYLWSLGVCLLATPVIAGSLRTIDGKMLEGDLRVEGGQLLLVPRRGEPTSVDLQNVLSASFLHAEQPKPLPLRPPQPKKLDPRWKTQDVGPTGTPGSVALLNDKYSVSGAGANIKGAADSFFFVYQELRGDGQIVARLSDLQLINPDEKAGLMIREKFNERGSRCAFLHFKPQDGSSFAWRADAGGNLASTPPAAEDKPPAWLKLTRQRGVITAYKSLDGEAWVRVGTPQDLPMEERVFAGMAVCSRDVNAACVATFEGVYVQPGIVGDDVPPRLPGSHDSNNAPVMFRSVVLRSGATLADIYIESADDREVHLVRGGKPMTLATADVARLVLAPVRAQQLVKVPPTGAGVLLARGDFMEGDLESLKGGRVKLNSIIFGPADFAAGGEVLLIALHDLGAVGENAAWVLRTNDGTLFTAKSLRMEGNEFVVDDELSGVTRVASASVAELTAGGGGFDRLVDVRPGKVDVLAGASTAGAYATPDAIGIGGHATPRPLVVHSGTTLRYEVAGKYTAFLARLGVADGTLPLVAVRLVVSVDGQDVFQSPPITSFDEPATIAAPLGAAQRMAIRVESVGDAALPATAVVAEGMLVK